MIGIYKIENTHTHKVYIGQSTNIESRWEHHLTALKHNKHRNAHLQNAWNKYGAECFTFSILEECSIDRLTEREQYYIDLYGGLNSNKNYNHREASDKGHLSEESKRKVSNSLKGNIPWNKGLTADDDRVARGAIKLRGTHLSEEQKKQISKTVKAHHDNGDYDYAKSNEKRLATMYKNTANGKVRKPRKDIGCKRNADVGAKISEAKKRGYAQRKALGIKRVAPNKGMKFNKETRKYECIIGCEVSSKDLE